MWTNILIFTALLRVVDSDPTPELHDKNEEYQLLEEAVLVFGSHFSGKDTLLQILTKDNKDLTSTYASPGKYKIVSHNGLDVENSMGQALYPVLMSNNENFVDFYNCPAFDISRSNRDHFVMDFYFRKMLKSVETIKFMFVIDFDSVNSDDSYRLYSELVQFISRLSNVQNKFENSMMLVISKADPFLHDEDIYQVFKNVQSSFENTADSNPNLQSINNIFQNRENLAISRLPSAFGSLKENAAVQAEKKYIFDVLQRIPAVNLNHNEITSFLVNKSENDFKEVLVNIFNQLHINNFNLYFIGTRMGKRKFGDGSRSWNIMGSWQNTENNPARQRLLRTFSYLGWNFKNSQRCSRRNEKM